MVNGRVRNAATNSFLANGSPFDTKFRNIENMSLSSANVYSVAGGKRNLNVTVGLAQSSDTRVSDQAGPVSVNSLSGDYTNYQTNNPLANAFALQEADGKPRKKTAGINLDYKLVGQDANLGVMLRERLHNVGVACELVYPGANGSTHWSAGNYLIARISGGKHEHQVGGSARR